LVYCVLCLLFALFCLTAFLLYFSLLYSDLWKNKPMRSPKEGSRVLCVGKGCGKPHEQIQLATHDILLHFHPRPKSKGWNSLNFWKRKCGLRSDGDVNNVQYRG
jgi:hypothetical protein